MKIDSFEDLIKYINISEENPKEEANNCMVVDKTVSASDNEKQQNSILKLSEGSVIGRKISTGKNEITVITKKKTKNKINIKQNISNYQKSACRDENKIKETELTDETNVENNTETQIEQIKEDIELCIGLDIGTSTTKAVISCSDKEIFYLVDFKEKGCQNQKQTYLLPTSVYFNQIYSLLPKKESIKFTNLKYKYFFGKQKSDEEFRMYIALTIKYIKDWFYQNYGKKDNYKNKNIIWSLNVGIPTKPFDNNKIISKYEKLLREAYLLSKQTNFSKRKKYEIDEDVELHIIPEVIATVQSYLKADTASKEGLYCIVDVGASTLDASTFRIYSDGNTTKYTMLESTVEELGTRFYQESLFYDANNINNKIKFDKWIQNKQLDNVTEDISSYLIEGGNPLFYKKFIKILSDEKFIENMNKKDKIYNDKNRCLSYFIENLRDSLSNEYDKNTEKYKFFKKCENKIITITHQTCLKRDPNAKVWDYGYLPIMICGGGYNITGYYDMIMKGSNDRIQENHGNCRGFYEQKLPEINYITSLNKNKIDNKRIIVAQGLSYPWIEFQDDKRINPEHEVPNLTKNLIHKEISEITKDQC